MDKFALIRKQEETQEPPAEDLTQKVIDVLVSQLGYKLSEAKTMVAEAMKRNKSISCPEELFEEVYRGEAP